VRTGAQTECFPDHVCVASGIVIVNRPNPGGQIAGRVFAWLHRRLAIVGGGWIWGIGLVRGIPAVALRRIPELRVIGGLGWLRGYGRAIAGLRVVHGLLKRCAVKAGLCLGWISILTLGEAGCWSSGLTGRYLWEAGRGSTGGIPTRALGVCVGIRRLRIGRRRRLEGRLLLAWSPGWWRRIWGKTSRLWLLRRWGLLLLLLLLLLNRSTGLVCISHLRTDREYDSMKKRKSFSGWC
jgi:hypothetical protein